MYTKKHMFTNINTHKHTHTHTHKRKHTPTHTHRHINIFTSIHRDRKNTQKTQSHIRTNINK